MAHPMIRIELLDPHTLLVDVNVRRDVQRDKQFVDSIRDHGVLAPIVAIDTPFGIRVRHGHRRTLAAVESGHDKVPVFVVDPRTGDPNANVAEIEQLVTQHVKNIHRAGLPSDDEDGFAGQLAAFGLSMIRSRGGAAEDEAAS